MKRTISPIFSRKELVLAIVFCLLFVLSIGFHIYDGKLNRLNKATELEEPLVVPREPLCIVYNPTEGKVGNGSYIDENGLLLTVSHLMNDSDSTSPTFSVLSSQNKGWTDYVIRSIQGELLLLEPKVPKNDMKYKYFEVATHSRGWTETGHFYYLLAYSATAALWIDQKFPSHLYGDDRYTSDSEKIFLDIPQINMIPVRGDILAVNKPYMRGFSGAPLIDETRNKVIAILVCTTEKEESGDVTLSLFITTRRLAQELNSALQE